MDATYIALLLTAWCVISIPASLLIGSAIAIGTEETAGTIDVEQAA